MHLHDHDIVGLCNRLGVAVGVPRAVPAHGVATRGVAEAERVMSDAYFDRGPRRGAGYDIAERPADWGGLASLVDRAIAAMFTKTLCGATRLWSRVDRGIGTIATLVILRWTEVFAPE